VTDGRRDIIPNGRQWCSLPQECFRSQSGRSYLPLSALETDPPKAHSPAWTSERTNRNTSTEHAAGDSVSLDSYSARECKVTSRASAPDPSSHRPGSEPCKDNFHYAGYEVSKRLTLLSPAYFSTLKMETPVLTGFTRCHIPEGGNLQFPLFLVLLHPPSRLESVLLKQRFSVGQSRRI
jgi:hypothetical protein